MLKRGVLKRKPLRKTRRIALKASKLPQKRHRRKKGQLTKLKESLWLLCRQITKQRYGNSCYTCGREVPDGKGMHTGHYITSSLCSIPLRYDLRNLRPQCYHDNINLSGNWPAYKKAIEAELGTGITAELIAFNEATKGKTYPLSYFHSKIEEYEKILEKYETEKGL